MTEVWPLRKNLIFSLIVFVVCTVFHTQGGNAAEVARKTYAPKKLSGDSISIDGLLSEPVWKKAKWCYDFSAVGEKPRASQVCRTGFAIACDKEQIYIAVVCEEPEIDSLTPFDNVRDGNLWQGNCVEIFLMAKPENDPDPNHEEQFHHFLVDPWNTQCDLYDGKKEWNGYWKSATYRGKNIWQAEISIPFATLNIERETTSDWLFNITRERRTGKEEQLTTWALTENFGDSRKFARLVGLETDYSLYQTNIQAPVIKRNGNRIDLQYSVNTTGNKTGIAKAYLLCLGEKDDSILTEGSISGEGQNSLISFTGLELDENGLCDAILKIKDQKGNTVKFARHTERFVFRPITINLLSPSYRNSIYASQKIGKIVTEIELMLETEKPYECLLQLTLKNSGEKILVSREATGFAGKKVFEFPCGELQAGTYRLDCALLQGEKVLARKSEDIHKLPSARESEVIPDGDRGLVVNGKPFFPWGFMGANSTAYVYLGEKGFNTVHSYTMHYKTTEEVIADLDKFHKAGLMVLLMPQARLKFHNGYKGTAWPAMSAKEIADMRKRINAIKEHPALLGYYLADEPSDSASVISALKKTYEIIKELDPYHPAILLHYKLRGYNAFRNCADIFWVDPYPGFKIGKVGDILRIANFMTEWKKGLPGKPVWLAPQAFNSDDFNEEKTGNRAPTYQELRTQVYLGIACGAGAIIPYKIGSPNDKGSNRGIFSETSPDLATGTLESLGREIEIFSKALHLKPDNGSVIISDHSLTCYYVRTKKHVYLAVVNPLGKTIKSRISFNTATPDKLPVVLENRQIQLTDNSFEDEFAPLATHVYSTDPSFLSLVK